MTGHLRAFIASAFQRIADGVYAIDGPAQPNNGSLRDAVVAPGPVIVAELKPRSPSEGPLLSAPPDEVLRHYRDNGAAAISCLADADHFDGSPALVRQAVETTGLPVLWKDFVVGPEQIDCAVHHGASAVLLIERCFEDAAERETLVAHAHAAGIEVLLEVHGDHEWRRARTSAADFFGVNARDLDTLEVDAPGALRLVSKIAAGGKPVLALSGVHDRAGRLAAERAGADGVLVGTALLKSRHPGLAVRAMRRPLAKVCGITNGDDLDVALEAGADLVGFIVGSESPRNLTPLQAQALVDQVAGRAQTVLVTRHRSEWNVREWCRLVRPDWVQLHGWVGEEAWLHSLSSIPTLAIHAVGVDDETPAGPIIIDNGPGGTGETVDWSVAGRVARHDWSLIAGGLDADNAPAAIDQSGASGADASSRLERSPGQKDPAAVRAFVAAVHGEPL